MEDISRIKTIMGLNEQQKPVTAPINIAALVKLLSVIHSQNPDTFESPSTIELNDRDMDYIASRLKLIGVNDDSDIRDFIVAFIRQNEGPIITGNFNPDEYKIPIKKNFKWFGEETYTARRTDTYRGEIEAYDRDSIEHWLHYGDFNIFDGMYVDSDTHDSWDIEQEIIDLDQIPMNESINEQNSSSKPLINTELLLKLITHTLISLGGKYYMEDILPDDQFMDKIADNLKLVGLKQDYLTLDYIFTFCKMNWNLIEDENFNIRDYKIPQKKEFRWTGREVYTARKADTYVGEEIGYSEEFFINDVDSLEFMVNDGRYQDEEVYDTFDMEQIIDDIVEVPVNEEISKDLRRLQNLFG
jgi:hypothetical protein